MWTFSNTQRYFIRQVVWTVIKCVTVCACDWLLFALFHLYSLYDMTYVLIIRIVCDVYKWQCLETRDGFHPVGKSRDLVENSVDYYPVAHSRHLM